MPRRGLPISIAMRHDEHYVEALAASAGAPIGRLVSIEEIDPNPNQPRQVMGDLAGADGVDRGEGHHRTDSSSVSAASGIQIVAGERRYQAAVQVGLRELPVVIRDVDDAEMLELALIENLQRKDLTPFRRSRGPAGPGGALRLHARRPGAAAGQVADVHHRVAGAGRHARGGAEAVSAGRHFHQVVASTGSSGKDARENDRPGREDCEPGRRATRQQVREATASEAGPAEGVCLCAIRPPDKAFNLKLPSARAGRSREDVIGALEAILRELRKKQVGAVQRARSGRDATARPKPGRRRRRTSVDQKLASGKSRATARTSSARSRRFCAKLRQRQSEAARHGCCAAFSV